MTIPTAEVKRITALLRTGQKAEAATLLRSLLKQNSKNIKALIWLGALTADYREGEIALKRALQLDPGNETAERYLVRLRALQAGEKLVTRWSKRNFATANRSANRKLALLIDADNARPALIGQVLAATGKYGALVMRRIYGDWTKAGMSGWKRALQTYAIQPVQQFQYTSGKNATDSALIIDAMDILHTHQVDGYCLVSSDSDYTRLAIRLAESGAFVMGIGKKRTPSAFVNACDVFLFTDSFFQGTATSLGDMVDQVPDRSDRSGASEIAILLEKAYQLAVQPDGRAYLGTLGIHLQRIDPGFDTRKYGHKQLSQLLKAHNELFELETIDSKVYVKLVDD